MAFTPLNSLNAFVVVARHRSYTAVLSAYYRQFSDIAFASLIRAEDAYEQ